MKSIIIGMGIGQLYKDVLANYFNSVVTTVDIVKGRGDFTCIEDAVKSNVKFDTAHVCVPNYLHYKIASEIAPHAQIVFVEKPGCFDSKEWLQLIQSHKSTKIMMVKNNMWRDNIKTITKSMQNSQLIKLTWTNKDRVPSPGSWFTNIDFAYGGVSRDLIPHLLSYIAAAFPDTYFNVKIRGNCKRRMWNLDQLSSTQYGQVNKNGVYNVDDRAWIDLELDDKKIEVHADWKNLLPDNRTISCQLGEEKIEFELGLCPESAYAAMIDDAIRNVSNDTFWGEQLKIDLWIHDIINKI